MQPYFFPYLGYFDLINRCDRWIIFDTAQYIRHGWVNRNRILHPEEGWQYVTVPLRKHHRETPINEIETEAPENWGPRILGQLGHYKKKAPGYKLAFGLVEECLAAGETNLARLNTFILGKLCSTLGIKFESQVFSAMNLNLGPVMAPGDWALRICEAIHADEYLNPPGGKELFDAGAFSQSGIRLLIQPAFEFTYECAGRPFEPGLSVIDALMWNTPQEIKTHLDGLKGGGAPGVGRQTGEDASPK
jgi:hypothetical protein